MSVNQAISLELKFRVSFFKKQKFSSSKLSEIQQDIKKVLKSKSKLVRYRTMQPGLKLDRVMMMRESLKNVKCIDEGLLHPTRHLSVPNAHESNKLIPR